MKIDDTRIQTIEPLTPPRQLIAEVRRSQTAESTVTDARARLNRILDGTDDRLIVVVGPCSIHDPQAALDYAGRLAGERARLADALEIVMRVYFEKPRTTVGWKGLVNDPLLDGSFRINLGLRTARELLLGINELGLPTGCEFLDVMTPQYIADLVSWGAIGARTTESQLHRQMASGLSCPIGFKNGTNGDVGIAIDAVKAAAHPHRFLALDKDGRAAIAATRGNDFGHIILRGGSTPNHDPESVAEAIRLCDAAGIEPRIMIDASHGNSRKEPKSQPGVAESIARQVAAGNRHIRGVMIESHIVSGNQDFEPGRTLVYGMSITDGCISWAETVPVLDRLAESARERRQAKVALDETAALSHRDSGG